jgi:hypothetical protein
MRAVDGEGWSKSGEGEGRGWVGSSCGVRDWVGTVRLRVIFRWKFDGGGCVFSGREEGRQREKTAEGWGLIRFCSKAQPAEEKEGSRGSPSKRRPWAVPARRVGRRGSRSGPRPDMEKPGTANASTEGGGRKSSSTRGAGRRRAQRGNRKTEQRGQWRQEEERGRTDPGTDLQN